MAPASRKGSQPAAPPGLSPMTIQLDDLLVEECVSLYLSRQNAVLPRDQVQAFHRQREQCYQLKNPDEQEQFARCYSRWFRFWGFEKRLLSALPEFPLLNRLATLAFRQARRPGEEGAELYVHPAQPRHHAVIALRSGRVQSAESLEIFLRHEFSHLQDMLDPVFGYAPELASQPALKERYRLLWDISIDGRLHGAGHQTLATRELHWEEMRRLFAFCSEQENFQRFETLWNGSQPTHAQLAAWAEDPRRRQGAAAPVPGAECPLCGFPTYGWVDATGFDPALVHEIQSEFPAWKTEHHACRQCADLYRARSTRQGTSASQGGTSVSQAVFNQ